MKALSCFLAITLVSFAADAPPPKAEEIAKSYKTLELLTPKPIRNPDPAFHTLLCTTPPATTQWIQQKRVMVGPHNGQVNRPRSQG